MNDALLHAPDRKAELSFAYLGALCAYVGYTCQRGPQPDRGSVDATVRAAGTMNPQFDVQLKATAVPDRKDDGLHFRLSANNYADLAEPERTSPILLVVLELPAREEDWLSCTERELALRRCAWWKSLRGAVQTDQQTITITIPNEQRLVPDTLQHLMERVRGGSL